MRRFLVALPLLAGCDLIEIPANCVTHVIEPPRVVRVVDAAGAPVADAEVVTTNAEGRVLACPGEECLMQSGTGRGYEGTPTGFYTAGFGGNPDEGTVFRFTVTARKGDAQASGAYRLTHGRCDGKVSGPSKIVIR